MSIVCASGCASNGTSAPTARAWSEWSRQAGGLTQGAQCERANLALDRLGDPHLGNLSKSLRVRVLDIDRPCAYVWPDGTLFVTKGLLGLLDDDELAGALAHEIGHLAGNSSWFKNAAFSGNGSTDCEVRADAAGCELLKSAGLSSRFLAQALAKVRDDPQTPASLRVPLSQRIQIIENRGL